MKYFARKKSIFNVGFAEEGIAYEITSRYALELYKGLSKAGQYNLVAVPNFNKGTLVNGKAFSVWGENISDAQCFKKRLDGTLAREILNKRIADEHKN
jgi:hypothetical protein